MIIKTEFMALNDPACINLTHNLSFVIDSYNFEVMTESIYPGCLLNCKNLFGRRNEM
jgi:hypothetical protein